MDVYRETLSKLEVQLASEPVAAGNETHDDH
jgi:hypothetical protein